MFSAPSASLTLVGDTIHEALARKIFWGLFALSTALILFFMFLLRIDIVEGAMATVTLFGGYLPRRFIDVHRLVRQAYAAIAAFLYTWQMLLAIFASAGLIPSMLDPGRVGLLLSKPVNRWRLLLARYAGNLLVVGANVVYLAVVLWVVLGWKTGIWSSRFLHTITSTIFVFAVLLAVVTLVAVVFEGAALAMMAPVALMLMSPILAQTRTVEKLLTSETARDVWRLLYYIFPKVYDVGRMTVRYVTDRQVDSWMPVWSSAVFGFVALIAAVAIFSRKDY